MGPTHQEEKARFAFETFRGKTFTEGRARSNLIWWEAEHRTHHEWGGKETANIPAVCRGPLLLWVKTGVRGSKKFGVKHHICRHGPKMWRTSSKLPPADRLSPWGGTWGGPGHRREGPTHTWHTKIKRPWLSSWLLMPNRQGGADAGRPGPLTNWGNGSGAPEMLCLACRAGGRGRQSPGRIGVTILFLKAPGAAPNGRRDTVLAAAWVL